MVTSPQIANDIAASVLGHRSFQAAAILLRQTEGHRNQYGEWVEGAAIETPVSLVHAPISGQERLVLEAGLRDEDVRTFWLLGDHPSLRYGLTDGDRFVLGALGTGQNRFDGVTRVIAERMRDTYAANNPAWLTAYQTTTTNAIQLRGFGHPGVPAVRCNRRALGGRRPIQGNAGEPLGRVYGSLGRTARSGECVMTTFAFVYLRCPNCTLHWVSPHSWKGITQWGIDRHYCPKCQQSGQFTGLIGDPGNA